MEAKCLRKKGKYGEGMNEKVKVILWMNALLEPKLLNARKSTNCWHPNLITSVEKSFRFSLCVLDCMI